jgi:hypothetical protein
MNSGTCSRTILTQHYAGEVCAPGEPLRNEHKRIFAASVRADKASRIQQVMDIQ